MSEHSIVVRPGTMILFVALALISYPALARAQDACELLPTSPVPEVETPKGTRYCEGSYWKRIAEAKVFGGLYEFGATISVGPTANATAARQQIDRWRRNPGARQADYGDGGYEIFENPSSNDRPVPTTSEREKKTLESEDMSTFTGEDGFRGYSGAFSCGSFVVFAHANPSKGHATRQLLSEMSASLRSRNVCGAAASTASTPATPTTTTTKTTSTPPRPADEAGTTGSSRTFDGNTAREIMDARANGSRYLVVLSRYHDPDRNCIVEERAWVADVRGSGGDRIAVRVGPSITVCTGGNVVSAAQVNKSERDLKQARDELAKALARKDEIEAYIKKDPSFRAQGTAQLQKIQEWINYYDKVIAGIQQGLAASTPQF